MHVLEAIQSRRTIFEFKPDPVPNDRLEALIAAGIWAPNHHLTEPWRFTVLGTQTKQLLAQIYAELRLEKKAPRDADAGQLARLRTKAVEKFLAKPTIVVVSCLQQGDEQRKREDYAATCCAIQNIQLAAWAEGIGMQWSTGPVIADPRTYELLGIDPTQEEIIALLYVGYPAEVPEPRRQPLSAVLRHTT